MVDRDQKIKDNVLKKAGATGIGLVFGRICMVLGASSLVGFLLFLVGMVISWNIIRRCEPSELEHLEMRKVPYDAALPKQEMKRRTIVETFNVRYDLTLTPYQITNIARASLISPEWEHEVYAMNHEYENVYEWYADGHGWLRAYIKAMYEQYIASDFDFQERVVLEKFDEIFSSVDFSKFRTQDAAINYINRNFRANFDDISFMIAYKFLLQHGKVYHIYEGSRVAHEDEHLDELLEKYKATPATGAPMGGGSRKG